MKKTLFWMLVCCLSLQVSAQKKVNILGGSVGEIKEETRIELPKPEYGSGLPLMEALKRRATSRSFLPEPLPMQEISNILWAANGVNRPQSGMRTAPSARNAQEIDVYVFLERGVFLYNADKHLLDPIVMKDFRKEVSSQKFFVEAPMVLVYVANYDKMVKFSDEAKEFYSATDVGFVSQNVYLYCASSNLSTVVCGMFNKELIQKVLNIKNGKILLVQPVGRTTE